MFSKDFIFSEKKPDRVKRHLVFWFFYWVCLTFLHLATPGWNFPYAMLYSFSVEVPQVFFTYALISFVLPRYLLRNKYFFSFLWITFFWLITAVVNYAMLKYASPLIAKTILPAQYIVRVNLGGGNMVMALISCFKGTMVAPAAACSIRLVKHWHLKEKRSLQLLKEKTEAQLQLLRAQVHPHFLFNTLNNIYSKAQNESPGSAKMIMELSHILRYVLDEGKLELVPLENELQMLTDYIDLEKMRYGDKLDLHLSLPSNTEGVHIAPLLLLPFVENCFKHGTSKMIHNPWINLKIELNGTSLVMKLMNGKKDFERIDDGHKGTGIWNVKERLDLLYKDKYDLQINEDDEVFIVNLTLELIKMTTRATEHEEIPKNIEYAL
jgi:two-component system, LytTR family, sensor kinase